ncbi:cytochrome P450 710A1-like [Brassica napus]|nr:cytochrome P450 710A1-like [Brassica napus]
MTLPFDIPGSAFHKARMAVKRLANILAVCAGKSKARMAAGEEPTCLIDFWMQPIVAEAASGNPPPPHSRDEEIGGFLFDFLFAAQDASTSSLLWAVTQLESKPDVLRRVREEVGSIWTPESNALITVDQLAEMKYTLNVAREVVRYRPPATMVPHVAAVDFPLTKTYTVPKGTIVFPSVFDSSFQGFTEPDQFDPDRFSETRKEDQVFKRNFLAFGWGSHQCVGQRYALNHLVLFIAMFSTLLDFKRLRSDGCDEIVYCPTISPKDGCTVFLSRRVAAYPYLTLN